MGTLVLRRLGAMIPVIILVTFGVFTLIHLTPGDPIDAMMGESFDPARHLLSHEVKAITYHELKVERTPVGWLAEAIVDI